LEFARSLRSPLLHEAIKDAEPLSPVYGFRRTENRFHHFERLSRWPDNFVVLGDAVSAFNPAYAQGMSAAVLGAVILDECLAAQRRRSQRELTGMAARFQKRLAKVSKVIWLMATSRDFRWPTTEGGRPGRMTRLLYRYMDGVQALAATSPLVHQRMLGHVQRLVRRVRPGARRAYFQRGRLQGATAGGAQPEAHSSTAHSGSPTVFIIRSFSRCIRFTSKRREYLIIARRCPGFP
jgi:hypothetical protein